MASEFEEGNSGVLVDSSWVANPHAIIAVAEGMVHWVAWLTEWVLGDDMRWASLLATTGAYWTSSLAGWTNVSASEEALDCQT